MSYWRPPPQVNLAVFGASEPERVAKQQISYRMPDGSIERVNVDELSSPFYRHADDYSLIENIGASNSANVRRVALSAEEWLDAL